MRPNGNEIICKMITNPENTHTQIGGKCADRGFGHLKPGSGPEPEIVFIWSLNNPDRPPNPSKKVECLAPHLSVWVWRRIGPV